MDAVHAWVHRFMFCILTKGDGFTQVFCYINVCISKRVCFMSHFF